MSEIKRLIKKGESKTVEFKETLPDGNHIAKSGKVVGLRRIDRYEVPMEVIREAVVNAVVHRDYSISGSDIKFAIFDDRIEVTSPGALPRSLEIEDIIAGRSEIRNKVIARFFKEIEFIKQWGNGIGKMIRLLESEGLRKPEFRESGLFFKVTISKHKKYAEEKQSTQINPETTPKTTSKTTPKSMSKLVELIKENPSVSLTELAIQLNITKDGIKYHLKNLKQQGIIKRIGSSRAGHWEINEDKKSKILYS